jgi:transcriptional regulator with XRE-family HTH domain
MSHRAVAFLNTNISYQINIELWAEPSPTAVFCDKISPMTTRSSRIKPLDIGSTLHKLRDRRHLSLRRLGEMTGIESVNLSRLEHGRVTPSLDTLDRVVKALGMTLSKFFSTMDRGNGGGHNHRVRLKPDEKKLLRSVQQFANRIDVGNKKETLKRVKNIITGA